MHRIGVTAVVLCLILTSLFAVGNFSSAQQDATPSVAALTVADAGETLFVADGVDAPVSASTDTDDVAVSDAHLVLERIQIPEAADLATHTAAAPELLLVEDGELSFEDEFGFSSTVEADEQLAINADASYTLFNDSDDAVFVLRLSLVSPNQESMQGTPVSDGTPVTGTPVAPAENIDASEVLLDRPVDSLPFGPATMFISQATFAPGSESGEQGHAGPLGIYVDEGVLSVQSPSGATGQIKAGSGVVLPEDAALEASNQEDTEGVVLIVGVVESGASLLSEVTPEPTAALVPTATATATATTAPTSTPEPTATLVPTATPAPTQTPLPTATIAPTATTAPTPTPTPVAPGSVLYEADTSGGLDAFDAGAGWNIVNGMLVSDGSSSAAVFAPFDPDGLTDYGVEAEIQIVQTDSYRDFSIFGRATDAGTMSLYSYSNPNGSTQGVAIVVTGADFQLEDYIDNGVYAPGEVIADQELGDDGDWHTYRLEVDGNQIRGLVDGAIVLATQDNRLLEPGLAGLWVYEDVQINVRAFRVVALGDDSATSASSTVASAETETAGSSGQTIASTSDPGDYLPTLSQVPSRLEVIDEGARSEQTIADSFSDPADAISRLDDWGWQGHAYRTFEAPTDTVPSGSTYFIDVSVHEFASPGGAAEALPYYADDRAVQLGLQEVPAQSMGDTSMAIAGTLDDGNETSVYVQSGRTLIRVTGWSETGDPTPDVLDVMDATLSNAGQSLGTAGVRTRTSPGPVQVQ